MTGYHNHANEVFYGWYKHFVQGCRARGSAGLDGGPKVRFAKELRKLI